MLCKAWLWDVSHRMAAQWQIMYNEYSSRMI